MITPATTGCAAAGGAAYFCQYVKNIIKTDPAFGATDGGPHPHPPARRTERLHDARLPRPDARRPGDEGVGADLGRGHGRSRRPASSAPRRSASRRPPGGSSRSRRTPSFSEDAALANDPNYSSLVYAADYKYGNSTGFPAGSTFKLFTLIDWLEKGHSVNEVAQRPGARHQADDQQLQRRLGQRRRTTASATSAAAAATPARRCSSPRSR